MKKLVTVGTLVAALALAGCAAGQPTSTTAPAAHNVATAGEASTTPSGQPTVEYSGATDELTAWVEQAHKEWVDFYEQDQTDVLMSVSGGGFEWIRSLEWESPAKGQIIVTVQGDGWNKTDLSSLAETFVQGIENEVESFTVRSEHGAVQETMSRSDIF